MATKIYRIKGMDKEYLCTKMVTNMMGNGKMISSMETAFSILLPSRGNTQALGLTIKCMGRESWSWKGSTSRKWSIITAAELSDSFDYY